MLRCCPFAETLPRGTRQGNDPGAARPGARGIIDSMKQRIPLEPLADSPAPTPEESGKVEPAAKSARERRTGSHIVDITEEFMGRSIIITGVKPSAK
jgi:hypothetical protein